MLCELGNGRQTSTPTQRSSFAAPRATNDARRLPFSPPIPVFRKECSCDLSAPQWVFRVTSCLLNLYQVSSFTRAEGVISCAPSGAARPGMSRERFSELNPKYPVGFPNKSCAHSRPEPPSKSDSITSDAWPLKSGSGRAGKEDDGPAGRTLQTSSDE